MSVQEIKSLRIILLQATYASSIIRNQMIDVISNQLRDKTISKVKEGRWFSVIADEITDESNKDQLSLVLRYLDHERLLIREDLVGFTECDTGTSGNSLATKITTTLLSMGLDLLYPRGQAYDGASNISGAINGAASLISKNYPLALYVHCASHCLNLAVVKSFQNTSIRNMMHVVDKVFFFFNAHPK